MDERGRDRGKGGMKTEKGNQETQKKSKGEKKVGEQETEGRE